MLTIAQITDLHVTTHAGDRIRNEGRLRTVLKAIANLRPRPAAIIASGDLADTGAVAEYQALAAIMATVEIPIFFAIGNHDLRGPMAEVFTEPMAKLDQNGFVQYTVDFADLRLVICDTVEEGESGGAFCEARAAWLRQTLDAAPQTPTVVVLHHPPIAGGIQWMDPVPGADWTSRLAAALVGRGQVLGIVCGHVHRPFHSSFAGHCVSVSAATALQLTLDLTPIDLRVPDGRQILLGEPPGFTLLCWDAGRLTIHNCVAGEFPDPIVYVAPFVRD